MEHPDLFAVVAAVAAVASAAAESPAELFENAPPDLAEKLCRLPKLIV